MRSKNGRSGLRRMRSTLATIDTTWRTDTQGVCRRRAKYYLSAALVHRLRAARRDEVVELGEQAGADEAVGRADRAGGRLERPVSRAEGPGDVKCITNGAHAASACATSSRDWRTAVPARKRCHVGGDSGEILERKRRRAGNGREGGVAGVSACFAGAISHRRQMRACMCN